MMKHEFVKKQTKIHFIGIGGIGMSGLARILLSLGYTVSGSDQMQSQVTMDLEKMGATIFPKHHENNIQNVTVVVFSSAISESNPELKRAKELKIPILKRAQLLSELMRLKQGIAIAGTHGKTTTTSFLATILYENNMSPTYIIGGIVKNLGNHASIEEGDWLLAEADESDGSFLLLDPIYSVITNVDSDHLEFYKTEENLQNAFLDFARKVPFYGLCALNAHDQILMSIQEKVSRPTITFAIDDKEIKDQTDKEKNANIKAKNISYSQEGSDFDLYYDDKFLIRIHITLLGRHNVLNALAAISIACAMGLSPQNIQRAIKKFDGVARRLQTLCKKNNLIIIDDYAHHPTAINETLKTLKKLYPDYQLICIFEPHRYSRTRDSWKEFLYCFHFSDELFLTPIYPASEEKIDGISSERLTQEINQLRPHFAQSLSSLDEISKFIKKDYDKKTILATLGAGPISKKVHSYL